MSLIKCKECHKKISKKANACPNCGAPMKKGMDGGLGCLLMILAFFVIYGVSFQFKSFKWPSSPFTSAEVQERIKEEEWMENLRRSQAVECRKLLGKANSFVKKGDLEGALKVLAKAKKLAYAKTDLSKVKKLDFRLRAIAFSPEPLLQKLKDSELDDIKLRRAVPERCKIDNLELQEKLLKRLMAGITEEEIRRQISRREDAMKEKIESIKKMAGGKTAALIIAKNIVKGKMKHPEEAKFPWNVGVAELNDQGEWTIWGTVTGKNSYGVKTKHKYKCTVKKINNENDLDDRNWKEIKTNLW